jgi:hypothetical protein
MIMIVHTFADKKSSVMIHTVTGEITFEEVKSSYEKVRTHPDFQENMNTIWDIREADASSFDPQDVIRLARYFETQITNRAEYRVAIIASRDLTYGLSRMYQVATADLPAKIGIFINHEDAAKWVKDQIPFKKDSHYRNT